MSIFTLRPFFCSSRHSGSSAFDCRQGSPAVNTTASIPISSFSFRMASRKYEVGAFSCVAVFELIGDKGSFSGVPARFMTVEQRAGYAFESPWIIL